MVLMQSVIYHSAIVFTGNRNEPSGSDATTYRFNAPGPRGGMTRDISAWAALHGMVRHETGRLQLSLSPWFDACLSIALNKRLFQSSILQFLLAWIANEKCSIWLPQVAAALALGSTRLSDRHSRWTVGASAMIALQASYCDRKTLPFRSLRKRLPCSRSITGPLTSERCSRTFWAASSCASA